MINDDNAQPLRPAGRQDEKEPMLPTMAPVDAQICKESAAETQSCRHQKRNREQACGRLKR
jgi:hypothetical protein